MRKSLRTIGVFLLAAALLAGSVPAQLYAEPAGGQDCGKDYRPGEPTPGTTFLDALVYRPVGLVAIPVGAALFVISLPFSATGGNVAAAFDNLVAAPARYTFCRPLGDL